MSVCDVVDAEVPSANRILIEEINLHAVLLGVKTIYRTKGLQIERILNVLAQKLWGPGYLRSEGQASIDFTERLINNLLYSFLERCCPRYLLNDSSHLWTHIR